MKDVAASIHLLEKTFSDPKSNLAMDEALLRELNDDPTQGETLRLWEPKRMMLVLGRSSHIEVEADDGPLHGMAGDAPDRRGGSGRSWSPG